MHKIEITQAKFYSGPVSDRYDIAAYKHNPNHATVLSELTREDCLQLADKIYEFFGVDKESEAFLRGVEEGRAAQ